MAEFALLALPMTLLLVGAINYSLNVLIDSEMRFEAISVARFGALADVSLIEANERAGRACESTRDKLESSCSVSFVGAYSAATFAYQPLSLVLLKPQRVIINAMVPLEIAK